jgi:hypothetical protein
MPALVARQGPLVGRRIEVAGEIVVGREGVDVLLEDPEVSRRHARLRPVEEGIEVEDLGSTNGTWVNDERLAASRRVAPGDRIRIGGTVLEVEPEFATEGPAPGTAPPAGAPAPPASTFQPPPHPIRRHVPSVRSVVPMVVTFTVIGVTAIALLLYFGLRG